MNPAKKIIFSYLKHHMVNPFLGLFNQKVVSSKSALRDWPGFFDHVKSLGFYPNTIIDVGVASFTKHLYEAFPDSRIMLIEPLIEFEESLQGLTKQFLRHKSMS